MDNLTGYEEWLTGQGLSRRTITQRVTFAQARLRAWGTLDQSPHAVAEWLGLYHGWTKGTYLSHLRSLYDYLVEVGHLEVSPVARMRRPPSPHPRPSPLSDVELARVLAAADGHLRTWLLLGYLAGLRCHEIAKIRGEDITSTSLVVVGKGGQSAILPTHPDLWAVAAGYPREGYWFPSVHAKREHISETQIGTKIRAHFRALGIEQGSVHRLRHTYGTRLARNGVTTRVVQDLMRHRSLATTQAYLDVSSEERLAAIATLVA